MKILSTLLIGIEFATQKIINKKNSNSVVGLQNLIEFRKELIIEYLEIEKKYKKTYQIQENDVIYIDG